MYGKRFILIESMSFKEQLFLFNDDDVQTGISYRLIAWKRTDTNPNLIDYIRRRRHSLTWVFIAILGVCFDKITRERRPFVAQDWQQRGERMGDRMVPS